jgi:hypothetical protein
LLSHAYNFALQAAVLDFVLLAGVLNLTCVFSFIVLLPVDWKDNQRYFMSSWKLAVRIFIYSGSRE